MPAEAGRPPATPVRRQRIGVRNATGNSTLVQSPVSSSSSPENETLVFAGAAALPLDDDDAKLTRTVCPQSHGLFDICRA